MDLLINGQARTFPELSPGASVAELVAALDLKGDRVAVEHNGQIVSRPSWATTGLTGGDRMEIVHFVGGGTDVYSSGCPDLLRQDTPGHAA